MLTFKFIYLGNLQNHRDCFVSAKVLYIRTVKWQRPGIPSLNLNALSTRHDCLFRVVTKKNQTKTTKKPKPNRQKIGTASCSVKNILSKSMLSSTLHKQTQPIKIINFLGWKTFSLTEYHLFPYLVFSKTLVFTCQHARKKHGRKVVVEVENSSHHKKREVMKEPAQCDLPSSM